jgi:phenylacetate-CoA ligase
MTILGEIIRRYGFWFVDALSGAQVRTYLSDLEKKMQGKTNASTGDLQKLLEHAVRTTVFYAAFKNYSGITDFPVIKKSQIKEKYDQFISTEYKNKPLHKVMTSGTSGERFMMLQDINKKKRVIAELLYFLQTSGFRLGYRYIYARVWFEDNRKSKLTQIAHNMLMFDCSSLSDDSLNRLYQILCHGNSIKCLAGYATFLEALAVYFNKKGYTPDMFDLEIVVSGAERLDQSTKALLKKIFGCTVVSRYANNENGFLAQQGLNDDEFILNTAHYFFETLKLDTDDPAPYGKPARLIVTDIYNRAMPLIRYDTGDIVIAKEYKKGGILKTVLTELSGRCDDFLYDIRGNKICPHFVALNFRKYDRLHLYQLVQDSSTNFTLRLEGTRGVYDDKDVSQSVQGLVGEDAVVNIVHMDKIPLTASGKFKKVICNYRPEQ